jgi:hypothetical protein
VVSFCGIADLSSFAGRWGEAVTLVGDFFSGWCLRQASRIWLVILGKMFHRKIDMAKEWEGEIFVFVH